MNNKKGLDEIEFSGNIYNTRIIDDILEEKSPENITYETCKEVESILSSTPCLALLAGESFSSEMYERFYKSIIKGIIVGGEEYVDKAKKQLVDDRFLQPSNREISLYINKTLRWNDKLKKRQSIQQFHQNLSEYIKYMVSFLSPNGQGNNTYSHEEKSEIYDMKDDIYYDIEQKIGSYMNEASFIHLLNIIGHEHKSEIVIGSEEKLYVTNNGLKSIKFGLKIFPNYLFNIQNIDNVGNLNQRPQDWCLASELFKTKNGKILEYYFTNILKYLDFSIDGHIGKFKDDNYEYSISPDLYIILKSHLEIIAHLTNISSVKPILLFNSYYRNNLSFKGLQITTGINPSQLSYMLNLLTMKYDNGYMNHNNGLYIFEVISALDKLQKEVNGYYSYCDKRSTNMSQRDLLTEAGICFMRNPTYVIENTFYCNSQIGVRYSPDIVKLFSTPINNFNFPELEELAQKLHVSEREVVDFVKYKQGFYIDEKVIFGKSIYSFTISDDLRRELYGHFQNK